MGSGLPERPREERDGLSAPPAGLWERDGPGCKEMGAPQPSLVQSLSCHCWAYETASVGLQATSVQSSGHLSSTPSEILCFSSL